MLSLTKVQAQKLRSKLILMTAVKRNAKEYGYQVMHENGTVFVIRRMDTPLPLTCTQLCTASALAKFLGFASWSVRELTEPVQENL